jgi:hypothetical protein
MRRPQTSPAPARLATRRRKSYVLSHQPSRSIMFSRIFRRGEAVRRFWAELANLGDRRIAGVLIAYLGR